MTLKGGIVTKLGLAYLSMPIIIFMIGWLRWEVGILACLLVVFGLIKVLRGCKRGKTLEPIVEPCNELKISPAVLFVLCGCVLLWCIFAGQGGFVVQTNDWNWRNATFRDLITHDWPVRYDQWNRALVLYVGHWLPSALVGKLIMASVGDVQWAWRIGNVALLFWTYAGVMLVLAQLLLLVNANSRRRQLGALLLLVFFGGCGALGTMILGCGQLIFGWQYRFAWWEFHPWWAGWCQFSSNSTCLYWVFNQTIAPWVAILLLARGVRLADIAFVLALVLICAPIPSMGVGFFVAVLVVRGLIELVKSDKWHDVVSGVFSSQNIIGVFVIVPIVFLYLSANPRSAGFSFAWVGMALDFFVCRTVLFLACEVGLYFLLTYKWFGKNIWWRTSLVLLCVCSLVEIDGGPEFCMRASIPAMMLLSIMCFCSYIKYKSSKLHSWSATALMLSMIVGALVPWREQMQYLGVLCKVGFGVVMEDKIVTFDQDLIRNYGPQGEWIVSSCNAKDYESMPFYRYLAKRSEVIKEDRQ